MVQPDDNGSFMAWLPHALDLAGTFVFGLSGAMAGVRYRLDVFGVLVLSAAAANTGGVTRDLVIGATPPAAVADWHYLGVSLLAGLITFCFPSTVARQRSPVLLFDAAGLAFFAVAGAHRALDYGLSPAMATTLGMWTAIGGGVARDVLLAHVPIVLRARVYAVAALLGAGIVVIGLKLRVPYVVAASVGALVCFGVRVVAMKQGWQLPVADHDDQRPTDATANDGSAPPPRRDIGT